MADPKGKRKPATYGSSYMDFDPVMEQSRKDKKEILKASISKKESIRISTTTIKPTLSTRVELQTSQKSSSNKPNLGKPIKYAVPKTRKQKREEMERHKKFDEEMNFCKYKIMKLPSPVDITKIQKKYQSPSAEITEAKVMPEKPSLSPSDIYPDPPTKADLTLKKPKSGIFINETKKERRHRRSGEAKPKRRSKARHTRQRSVSKTTPSKAQSISKQQSKTEADRENFLTEAEEFEFAEAEELATIEEMMKGEGEGEGERMDETALTKQFRKTVARLSKTTSIRSKELRMVGSEEIKLEEHEEEKEEKMSKIIQKFRRDSEIEHYDLPKRKIKRGSFESHSFTKLKQPILKAFYFGVKLGTIHQGDEHFEKTTRNRQGICMSIAAYCMSMIKHPDKWAQLDIDKVLESGNGLYIESANFKHIHNGDRELSIKELQKYCKIGDKKIRFEVSEPEVSGMLRSDNKKIYNITKALNIFFGRHHAGILQTDTINLAIWKDKHFYLFDAQPRSVDLFTTTTQNGAALLAHFYDLTSIISVLLTRSGLANPPFLIYSIKAFRILPKDIDDIESKDIIDERDNYMILNDCKAVVLGSFDLADKCFGFSRNKQALTIALVALVYSRITPASAWHKMTIDKIMIIGNQLFLECVQCDDSKMLTLNDLPAYFTIGPYLVEIYIYTNRYADLMFKKSECMLKPAFEKFFEKHTNAILQIDRYILAVWKQRNMFHLFDPYSRNSEGLRCRDGEACALMFSNIDSLVDTLSINFESKDFIFYIHALKVCKIHRDPDMCSIFPKNLTMNDYPLDSFKKVKMRKGKKTATIKPVTVDFTAKAAMSDQYPEGSIFEIGSNVKSLDVDELPPMVHKFPSRSVLKSLPPSEDYVVDLDSPSLSDTQIEPPPPEDGDDEEEEIEMVDLDSYELTQEELALHGNEEAENIGAEESNLMKEMEQELEAEAQRAEDEGDQDWYMAAGAYSQVNSKSLDSYKSQLSAGINTDLTFFSTPKEELPTVVRKDILLKKRNKRLSSGIWDVELLPEPEVTQSEELRRETNFLDLPDDSQIVLGTKNMSDLAGDENLEFMAPFICIMAAAVSRKYAIHSWSKDIVDYVLKCGFELFKNAETRYDQVYRLEIPRVSLGKTDVSIQVSYIFDTFFRQRVVEMAISRILFTKSDCGILVTPTYACFVMYKNHLYYLYDGFGNSEVGLSNGRTNEGVAVLTRFKNVHSLVSRIIYNKSKRETGQCIEYNRFVLSSCKVKILSKRQKLADDAEEKLAETAGEDGSSDEDDSAPIKQKEPKKQDFEECEHKIGYHRVDGFAKIQGSRSLEGGNEASDFLKEDYFVCLCACLMLLSCPVVKWDERRIDQVMDQGQHLYSHANDLEINSKKIIKNILIENYFFNIVAKRTRFANYKANLHLRMGIETMLSKKHEHFLLQFPNRSYIISVKDQSYHLFDPNDESGKASWTKFTTLRKLLRQIQKHGRDSFNFHTFEVTSITKAPKNIVLSNRSKKYRMKKEPKFEYIGQKPFYEETFWLNVEPIPWSKRQIHTCDRWHDWNIEFPNDLFSLFGSIHQNSNKFAAISRGKQALCNSIVAIAMTEIYDLSEWNEAIVDAILVNGDNYCIECIKEIQDEDYELSVDDLKPECSIFPYSFEIELNPVVDGTMFLVRKKQFNLFKALRYFFEDYDKRFGLITVSRGNNRRHRNVAFGKIQDSEYFLFDCETFGGPMFLDGEGVAYILRTTSLNRLLHVLTLTLRGGDFYIFDVKISELKSIM